MKRLNVTPLFLLKNGRVLTVLISVLMMLVFGGCHSNQNQSNYSDYCTVKGSVKGLKNGTKLELQDEFRHYDIVGTGVVKDGTFEIYPDVTSPAHVYLYVHNGKQLKDFILEPGTILVEVDATDEEDFATGATGTVSNDMIRKIRNYRLSGDKNAEDSLKAEVMNANPAGPLALANIEYWCKSSAQALDVLDRLSPELAELAYIDELREELTRRMKTEPRTEGSDIVPMYIDMEYPDVNGTPISLSSVVNNPDNRYVLVDFWATWCGGCLEELPQLEEIYAKYHDKGLEIYGLSVNLHHKDWEKFLAKKPLAWVNVCDGSGGRKGSCKVRDDYALRAYPTTLLIDCQTGEIIARDNELDELDAMLAEFFEPKITEPPHVSDDDNGQH